MKTGQAFSFFYLKKMRSWYLGNYKKEGEKYLHVLIGDVKNKMLGPSGPPLMHLSVNERDDIIWLLIADLITSS